MIYDNLDWSRIYFVLLIQPIISIIYLYLAFKVIKRSKNQITKILCIYYIITGITFILNIIFLFLLIFIAQENLYYFYLIMLLILIFSQIFIVVFIHNLLYISFYNLKKQIMIVFVYLISCILLLNIPGAIIINKETNWTPLYSWNFLIITYIFFAVWIVIPTFIYSIKLYTSFEVIPLKKKLKYFIIGIFGMFIVIYGGILYNTWQNPFFKILYPLISFGLIVSSGFLIYYGIGQNL